MTEIPKATFRNLAVLLIRAGIRLRARNRTVCSAIMMVNRLSKTDLINDVCNYTLATACLTVAVKQMEENHIGIRDVINSVHRVLHPDEKMMEIGEQFWGIRYGIARMEFIVLRFLSFDIQFEDPFVPLALYLDALRSWLPREFQEKQVIESCNAVMRDCFTFPRLFEERKVHEIAIAVLCFVLRGKDIELPRTSKPWFQKLYKSSLSSRRVRKLEKVIATEVYGLQLEESPEKIKSN
ncbi:unnamed protein product [Caenorhabditis auriculariae]|uniref:Cyclin-related protein FAM58A n=1 Tax=Caenorhabditis auriculariae TaxID=2777116 RepID=A0A8S1HSA5_9PELO|nr:unnamed protein product [Caenorhabditis auriculariae]